MKNIMYLTCDSVEVPLRLNTYDIWGHFIILYFKQFYI